MGKSFLKQAEQNVINQARAWSEALVFVDALYNFGSNACHEWIGKKQFFEGLQMIRNAMYAEQADAIRNCFVLSGIGGEEAKAFAREKFKESFGGKYCVIQFLNAWGHMPSSFSPKDEKEFLAECAKEIEGFDK
jgi:hypothetical protein